MWHADLLGEQARLTPEREALVELATGRRLTYRQLDQRAGALAWVLRRHLGLQPGDRLAVLSSNRLEFLELFFASAKSGVVFVPVNPRLAVPEMANVLSHAQPEGLLFSEELAETALAAAEGQPIRHLLALGGGHPSRLPSLASLLPTSQPAKLPPPEGGEAPLAILYTSGTTGEPKGVVISHRMVAFNAWATAIAWELRSDDVSPIFTPLCHAGGLFAFLTPLLAVGGKVVLHVRFDPEEVWRAMAAEGCTVALGVPTLWRLLAEHPLFEKVDLSRVRWFISGGAPLPLGLIERYRERGLVLRQGYGLTEVGVNCFTMGNEDAWRKAGSVGKPMPFTRAKVVGEDGRACTVGDVGELLLAGPHVCSGYFRNPQATAEALDGEGFFHTGDLVRCDEEGFYSVVGRRKEMFISGGVNIYPAEIEAVLLTHPRVRDAAVVGVPDELWGEMGVAFVVADGQVADQELAGFLRNRMAAYKVPKAFRFVKSLPRTAYGKVLRRKLVEWFLSQGEDSQG